MQPRSPHQASNEAGELQPRGPSVTAQDCPSLAVLKISHARICDYYRSRAPDRMPKDIVLQADIDSEKRLHRARNSASSNSYFRDGSLPYVIGRRGLCTIIE